MLWQRKAKRAHKPRPDIPSRGAALACPTSAAGLDPRRYEVNEARVGLAGVFPVQAACALSACAFARHRHRQRRRFQRRMIEAFADKVVGGQQLYFGST